MSAVIVTPARVGAEERIGSGVEHDFPHLDVVDESMVRRNLEEGIRLFENMVNLIALVVVLCAALLLMTVMLTTVKERTREIGVLRALGASKPTVVRAILWEILLRDRKRDGRHPARRVAALRVKDRTQIKTET